MSNKNHFYFSNDIDLMPPPPVIKKPKKIKTKTRKPPTPSSESKENDKVVEDSSATRVGEGSEGFSCTSCRQTFESDSLLDVHLKECTKDQDLSCLKCQITFAKSTEVSLFIDFRTFEKL